MIPPVMSEVHEVENILTAPFLCSASLIPRPLPDFISQPYREGLGSLLRHRQEMVDLVRTD